LQLALAAEVQNSLFPKKVPLIPDFDFAGIHEASAFVSGNYYDFIELDRDHVGVLVASTSAQAVAGALVMVQVRTLLRSEVKQAISPREGLIRVNRKIAGELPKGICVSMFYVVLDVPTWEMTACSAGHDPMIFWSGSAGRNQIVNTNGMALGLDPGPLFDKTLAERRLVLAPGDRFLLTTRGAAATRNEANEPYGMERLAARFGHADRQDATGALVSIASGLDEFRGGAPKTEDVTMVCVRHVDEMMIVETPLPQPTRAVHGKKCSFCEAVSAPGAEECEICHEPLVAPPEARLAAKAGEIECSCGRILKLTRDLRSCPRCGRLI
jgi:sigma-B regulation protein RsbU (phosphoserine phosphatase)